MPAFFYYNGTEFKLRVNGGTTSITFAAASNAGNFYRLGIINLTSSGTYSIYKNVVDTGSATGVSHYTPSISTIPTPTNLANNSPSRFINTEVAVAVVATNTDYSLEWQDIPFSGLPNPYPTTSFPGSAQASGASINAGGTVLSGITLYPYGNVPGSVFQKKYTFVKDASVWRTAIDTFVLDTGVWRTITDTFVRDAGVWKDVYRNYDTFTVITINEPGADALDFAVEVKSLN